MADNPESQSREQGAEMIQRDIKEFVKFLDIVNFGAGFKQGKEDMVLPGDNLIVFSGFIAFLVGVFKGAMEILCPFFNQKL
jgi:hypothetical protein